MEKIAKSGVTKRTMAPREKLFLMALLISVAACLSWLIQKKVEAVSDRYVYVML